MFGAKPAESTSLPDFDVDEALCGELGLEVGAERLGLAERFFLKFGELWHAAGRYACFLKGLGIVSGVGDALANFGEQIGAWDCWIIAASSGNDRLGLLLAFYG